MKYIQYTILAILSLFLFGCGYDVILQYERNPAVSYRLTIATDDHQEASSVLVQAFKDEGLEPVLGSKFGSYEGYSIGNSKNRMIFILYYTPLDYKRVTISLYPSRLVSHSKNRKKELEKEKQSLLRIKNKLEKTDIFDEHIGTAAQGRNGQPTGIPPKPK